MLVFSLASYTFFSFVLIFCILYIFQIKYTDDDDGHNYIRGNDLFFFYDLLLFVSLSVRLSEVCFVLTAHFYTSIWMDKTRTAGFQFWLYTFYSYVRGSFLLFLSCFFHFIFLFFILFCFHLDFELSVLECARTATTATTKLERQLL